MNHQCIEVAEFIITMHICKLTLRHDISPYDRVITKLKHYLAEAQKWVLFDPYKFTGDGWTLLPIKLTIYIRYI